MFSKLWSKLRTVYRHRYLLLETLFWLAIARLAMVTLPFRWLTLNMGERMAETPIETLPLEQRRTLFRIAWAIRKLSPHTPWQSKCLVQAMTAKRMLQRRKINSTLYLGVLINKENDPADSDPLKAHAWLRSGRMLLTGAPGHRRFTVVATFAEPS